MDRFSSKEDPRPWAPGAFDDGFSARVNGHPMLSAPSADVIGSWSHKSWRAGWTDADAGLSADREAGNEDGLLVADQIHPKACTMTRNDARALWASSGLDYSVLTQDNLRILIGHIDVAMNVSGNMNGTYRMRRSLNLRQRDGKLIQAELKCKAFYFDNREAVTFGSDGFVGFAGWADEKNVAPILAGFQRWVGELKVFRAICG